MKLPIEELPRMIDEALAALSSDRSAVGLSLELSGGRARASMAELDLSFGDGALEDVLAWELLVDALPTAVERARLAAMHDAVGAAWAAPWSVYTTATALAWLTWASGGIGTPRWRHNVGMILSAAERDGGVPLAPPGAAGPTMSGELRSRQLLGLIQTGPRTHYIVAEGKLLANALVPDTVAVALTGRDASSIVDAPWLVGQDVVVADAMVGDEGTLLILEEAMLPLEPIPPIAAAAAPPDGPAHAPWIVTKAERNALDDVDLSVHRGA